MRWASLPGLGGTAASFRWFGYELSSGTISDPMPVANGTSASPIVSAYSIAATTDGASTNPFSLQASTRYVAKGPALNTVIGTTNADTTSSRRYIVFNTIASNTITTPSDLTAIT